jgi:mRNA-degrading endonuclease toxin of MazEF toxin-antitoxin module
MQTDLLNSVGHPSTFILPCTTKRTGESMLRVELPKGIAGNTKDCEIMLDQGRAIDNARFRKLLGALSRSVLSEVRNKLRLLLDL